MWPTTTPLKMQTRPPRCLPLKWPRRPALRKQQGRARPSRPQKTPLRSHLPTLVCSRLQPATSRNGRKASSTSRRSTSRGSPACLSTTAACTQRRRSAPSRCWIRLWTWAVRCARTRSGGAARSARSSSRSPTSATHPPMGTEPPPQPLAIPPVPARWRNSTNASTSLKRRTTSGSRPSPTRPASSPASSAATPAGGATLHAQTSPSRTSRNNRLREVLCGAPLSAGAPATCTGPVWRPGRAPPPAAGAAQSRRSSPAMSSGTPTGAAPSQRLLAWL
mmetsp:Transcript_20942/g.59193  ORF Transcript_20942/g.59193 Transcript_20942/m.59193 type:complete len:277 (+) Transcript_20942:383-1213(+)